MDLDAVERRLAAILSADVVGYSRLMARDEVATVRALQAYREHMAVLIRQHRGRVVDFAGDSLLAEFPSALDAVRCALEIQRVLKARNADVPADRKMEFRVGVHLGDVMVEGERIYGEGINIAARLEHLAESGGICVSGPVYAQVRNKLAVAWGDLGEQSVKNIPDPVHVYQLRWQPEAAAGEELIPGAGALAGRGLVGRPDITVLIVPAAWVFYVAIVLEILFMISPFALYYYSAYGPAMNVLHRSSWTAWLTHFFLPHFSETSSPVLNGLPDLAEPLVILGAVLFVVAFGQIYWVKARHGGPVTGGLYVLARHPQYLGLAIVGLGALLAWPRFLVLVMYVTMLFLYGFMARWEEERCLQKFGERYRAYQARTGMFFPRPVFGRLRLPLAGEQGLIAALALYVIAIGGAAGVGYLLRDYSLSRVSALYTENMAVLSPARLSDEEMRAALRVATAAGDVRAELDAAGRAAGLLVYVLPVEWEIADLPMVITEEHRGEHYVPAGFDRRLYKVLFTRPRAHGRAPRGEEVVKRAYGRDPIIMVRVNTETAEITGIETPPPHVRWGDIPTPLF